jgi:hypothetical protein
VQFSSEVLLSKSEPAVCAIATEAPVRASNAIVMINFRIMVSRVGAPLTIMVTGSSITSCGKPHVSFSCCSTSLQLGVQRLHSARGPTVGCLAALSRIAWHFTIAGKKLLIVHAKWIGRYDGRGVKSLHGSVL